MFIRTESVTNAAAGQRIHQERWLDTATRYAAFGPLRLKTKLSQLWLQAERSLCAKSKLVSVVDGEIVLPVD